MAVFSGVNKVGLFIRLNDTGADGFIPARTLGADYFVHDEDGHAMRGERTGETFRLGDRVDIKLIEVVPTAGAMRFEMLTEGTMEDPPKRRGRGGSRGRYDGGGRGGGGGRGRNDSRGNSRSKGSSGGYSASNSNAVTSNSVTNSVTNSAASPASEETSNTGTGRKNKKLGGFIKRPGRKGS